ncbi:MAG: acyl--CoA ligase [Thermogemmatispora sp.]|uniref:class I adenylate-forming enzyme family protein n=1 Tax=Thermogemmatispora sp. TaxID=1968838 RepID=UPI0026134F88|nr:class I adenylate-forming enzyme family protein [Thermogemmatispora sp.]MBX5457044.1 acyl--CoA ligase [Thermogemmatispora sp.]
MRPEPSVASGPLPERTRETHYGRAVLTYARRPRHFNEVLRRSVETFPEKTALVFEGQRWSYRHLWEEACSLAAVLQEDYAFDVGERLAVLTGNLPEFVIAAVGCSLLGGVLVPLNTRLRGPELCALLAHSGSRVLITTTEHWEQLAPERAALKELQGVFVIGDEHPQGPAGTRPWRDLLRGGHPRPVEIGEDSPVYLCYTSGTTGLPKGVICTHFNLIHTLLNYELVKGLSADDITLLGVPIFHITGLAAQFAQFLYQGGTLVLQRLPFRPGPALELIERERVTHFFGVPTMYIMLMNHSDFRQRDSSSLRLAASGGAPLPPDVVRSWTQKAPQVRFFNFYGLTETTSPATCLPDRYKLERPGSAGLPLPVSELLVVGDNHEPLPPGTVGELAIRGPMVFKEYWRNPEATQAAFLDGGWFLTGDMARLDEDGFVHIVDRKKDMINRAGEKIYCAEVENVLYGHPAVLEVAVVGQADPFYGEIVKAVVVPRPGQVLDTEELRTFAAQHLASFKVPALIEVRDELPRNPGGKVMKQLLRGR